MRPSEAKAEPRHRVDGFAAAHAERYTCAGVPMPHSAPSRHQQQPDYIFIAVLCVCVLIVPAAFSASCSPLMQCFPGQPRTVN